MAIIRWGIIGCGDVTEVKSGPALQQAADSELTAVMRRDGALAADYARRHGVPVWYDDADKLIGDPDVDAIYVATPPAAHKDYALRAAAAGKPVYVEKPMALNHGECQEMLEACDRADIPLFVAYYRRALPRFQVIKEWIDSGAIGDVRFVTMKHYAKPQVQPGDELPWRLVPEIAGGGLFVDVACHTLDIMDYLLGPIVDVHGCASNQGGLYAVEDTVSASFTFSPTVHGIGVWCFAACDDVEVNEIVGTEGTVRFATFGSDPLRLENQDGITIREVENPKHIQRPLIQTVVDHLNGRAVCSSTGVTAARTSRVIDQILQNRMD